jgi:hypothetical protein
MAYRGELLSTTRALDSQGHTLSSKIDLFLNSVKAQPLGFRELGLNFIGIARIVSALRSSLESHIQSGLPFPDAAVPELLRVLKKSSDDFADLDKLLARFMEYERGGALGSLKKGWRMMFADKEVGRLDGQLKESQGALNMAMLLTNMYVNFYDLRPLLTRTVDRKRLMTASMGNWLPDCSNFKSQNLMGLHMQALSQLKLMGLVSPTRYQFPQPPRFLLTLD